ncbi:hypothetical protein LIER_21332 [Lithospermum erythrorhizon]|uniref:LOB domain-containing protein n=1 Tax=Lithospermum erythrorhizon TaxID=34254 RepID=A0AAV3QPY8_LITER
MASSSYSNSPCAACKFLRRKCLPECVFAPYFPPEEPHKFINVHRVFGASNVSKILNEILPHQREDAVNSLAYEAEARLKDPVYGSVRVISVLQRQILMLQKELEATNADLMRYTSNEHSAHAIPSMDGSSIIDHHQQYYQHGGWANFGNQNIGMSSDYYNDEGDGPCESGNGSM